MKKIKWILILYLFLMCGCQTSINKVTDNSYSEEAKYNAIHNAMQTTPMIDAEGHIYVYPSVKGRKKTYYFPMEIIDDKVYSLQDKKYSTCSYTNVDACTSLIETYNVNMNYYKGSMYFYEKRIEVEKRLNYLLNIDIKKASLNLSDKHKEYTIKSFGEPIFYEINYTYPNVQFHKDKVYACYNNELYIGHMNDSKLKKLSIFDQKNILKVFLENDSMYLYMKEYIEASKIYKNALLLCDLNGNVQDIIIDNKNILFADESYVFYLQKNKEKDMELCIYDIKNKVNKSIQVGNFKHVLKYDNMYLADTMGYDYNVNRITIINDKGEMVHDKQYDKIKHVSSILINDKYYVYTRKDEWFGYYTINENGISDFKLCSIAKKEESN